MVKEKFNNFYNMELDKTWKLTSRDDPCNINSEYSYSKEGIDKLDITLNIYNSSHNDTLL